VSLIRLDGCNLSYFIGWVYNGLLLCYCVSAYCIFPVEACLIQIAVLLHAYRLHPTFFGEVDSVVNVHRSRNS